MRKLPEGKAVLDEAGRIALDGFSEDERAQLATLLCRVNANLERAVQADGTGRELHVYCEENA